MSVGEIRFKILRAEAVPDWSPPQAFEGEIEPGMLWPERRCGLVLGCGPDGRDGLVLLEVQPAAGKAMGGAEFARGAGCSLGREFSASAFKKGGAVIVLSVLL